MDERFTDIYGEAAQAAGAAPGTVTLLGSHTSYNHGFALAWTTPQRTLVEISPSEDGLNRFCTAEMATPLVCAMEGKIRDGFAVSLFGTLLVLREAGYHVEPVRVLARPAFPEGAGLGYHAALRVAMIRALGELFRFRVGGMSEARLAQRVALEYGGIGCGAVEEAASASSDGERMVLLDAREWQYRLVVPPEGTGFLVIDSGVPSHFDDASYLERRGECEEACRRLRVPALREAADPGLLDGLPPLLRARAKHIVTENARVAEAAAGVPASRFGELLNDSQASLRDDYAVSRPEIDLLVRLMREHPQTFGARMAGAGMGGACVALVAAGSALDVAGDVLAAYRRHGGRGSLLVP